ncbi:MAG: putative sugar O-methyltransferase, partial [Chloroflexota bacterium]|nr:putative sugar O-methyltransferase [Chloroflexota bacterium]
MLDRTDLLELMVDDVNSAADVYKPGNFWDFINRNQIPELRKIGLHSFRSRQLPSKLATWAGDLTPSLGQVDFFSSRITYNRISKKIPLWESLLRFCNDVFNAVVPVAPSSDYDLRLDGLKVMAYECAKLWGEKVGAKSIDEFSASLIGDPEDTLEINGRVYTIPIIYFYMRYIYCSQFLDWDSVNTLVELGGGSGR